MSGASERRGTQGFWCPFIHELVDLLSRRTWVSVCQRRATQRTDLLRKLNKVLFTVVCTGTGLKDANGEVGQQDFEDSVTRVILVGRLDLASNDTGPKYFIKKQPLQEHRIEMQREAGARTLNVEPSIVVFMVGVGVSQILHSLSTELVMFYGPSQSQPKPR